MYVSGLSPRDDGGGGWSPTLPVSVGEPPLLKGPWLVSIGVNSNGYCPSELVRDTGEFLRSGLVRLVFDAGANSKDSVNLYERKDVVWLHIAK